MYDSINHKVVVVLMTSGGGREGKGVQLEIKTYGSYCVVKKASTSHYEHIYRKNKCNFT